MGRPRKKGLAYFPLDTDFISDRKIQRLFKKYGSEGITTYITILCEIYATNGYYIEFNKDLCFDIGFTLNMGERKVENMIKFCIQINLFDKKEFVANQILSSNGIQQRYREVFKRIRHIEPEIVSHQYPVVSDSETTVSATKTPTKGKGKGNTKENTNVKKKSDDRHDQSTDHSAISRAAQLQQMLDAATTSNKHA